MENQRRRILKMLFRRGERGVMNYEFTRLFPAILRYSSRVSELRKAGYQIKTTHVKKGVYKYVVEN